MVSIHRTGCLIENERRHRAQRVGHGRTMPAHVVEPGAGAEARPDDRGDPRNERGAEDAPRPIRDSIPEVPLWLCDVIARLHEKDPDRRFRSAREVADVLAAKVPGVKSFKVSSQLKQIFALNNSKRPNDVGLSYLDELISVDLGAAISDDSQALQLGRKDPAEVAASWDKLWQKARADGETLSRTGLPKC